MKTVIICEVFIFLKVYFFWKPVNFVNALYLKYIANITVKQFIKWCFTLWFYNLLKKIGKRKTEDDTFLRKRNRRKTKQCYHNDICRWKRDSPSNEVKITTGIARKHVKNKFLKKSNKFNWNKSPDEHDLWSCCFK